MQNYDEKFKKFTKLNFLVLKWKYLIDKQISKTKFAFYVSITKKVLNAEYEYIYILKNVCNLLEEQVYEILFTYFLKTFSSFLHYVRNSFLH